MQGLKNGDIIELGEHKIGKLWEARKSDIQQ